MSDCIEWPGTLNANGYGRLSLRKDMVESRGTKQIQATHLVWELLHGPVPKGKLIRHKCDNPPCVNPEHLEVGTQADNVDDMVTRLRDNPWGRWATHCKKGHPFSEENTYVVIRKRGGEERKERACKECGRIRSRERHRRNNPGIKIRGARVTLSEPGA